MYDTLDIHDGNCPPYSLILPPEKSGYHNWLIAQKKCTDPAIFILDYLGGQGTLVDVGANIGVISVPAAVAGSNVVSIEMIPENCLYLSLTILRNALKNMRLVQLAASDSRGITHFLATEDNGYVVPEGPPAVKMPLDDVIDLVALQNPHFIKPPVLVKIDTEGHELFVLRGATRLIEQLDPVFFFESIMIEGRHEGPDQRAEDVKRLLEQQGYHLYLHRNDHLIPRTARDLQEGFVSDYFASRRRYLPGERIGRHVVGPIALAERLAWIEEMIDFPSHWHRMHAAGVIARWRAEGIADPALDRHARRLIGHEDPQVAEFAGRVLTDFR